MEERIVKDGTKIIVPRNRNVHGVITGHYEELGKIYYKYHFKRKNGKEGDGVDLIRDQFIIVPIKFVNLTPNDIKLNNGTIYPASGVIAKVNNVFCDFFCNISVVDYGETENISEPEGGTYYIVSPLVLANENRLPKFMRRRDLVAPATEHPKCIKKDGLIISVPGFISNSY